MENKAPKEVLQKLRNETGAGIMDTRRAFLEANGNYDKAIAILREKGLLKVEKRSGRDTGAGLVHSYIHNERIGILLDLRAETDFVVRSEPFRKLAHELAMQIAASAPVGIEELLNQPYIKDETRLVRDMVNEVMARVGENIRVNQFYRIEI